MVEIDPDSFQYNPHMIESIESGEDKSKAPIKEIVALLLVIWALFGTVIGMVLICRVVF